MLFMKIINLILNILFFLYENDKKKSIINEIKENLSKI